MSSEQIPPLLPSRVGQGLPCRWRWLVTLLVTVALALVTGIIIWGGPLHRLIKPGPDFPKLQAQGEILVTALEKHHTKHGTYPPTLRDAGVAAYSKTQWGDWYYTPNGNGFELSLGDYDWDGFVLSWDRKIGWWLNQ